MDEQIRSSHPAMKEAGGRSAGLPAVLVAAIVIGLPAVLTYAMAVGNEVQVFGTAVIACLLALCFAKPFAGLGVFLALLYTRPEESIHELAGMHFTLIVAIVTLVGMFIEFCLAGRKTILTRYAAMAALLLVTAVVSSVVAGGEITDPLMDLGRLLILVILVSNLVRTPDRYAACVSLLIGLSLYLAAYSMYLFATGTVVHQDGIVRSQATGIFSDPNDLAATIAPAIALAASRFLNSAGARRFLYAVVCLVLLAAVVIANSRGGMLALGAIVLGYTLSGKSSPSAKATLIIVSIVVYLAGPARMTSFDTQEASANSRFWFWANGIDQLIAHPLLGVGYGQFASVNGGMVAHNSFVQCFAELGLIGYFFWMGALYFSLRVRRMQPPLIIGTITRRPRRAIAELVPAVASPEPIAARIALISYLVASFWLTHTYSPILYLLICLPPASVPVDQAENGGEAASATGWIDSVDLVRIAALCLGSIAVIKVLSDHYR